MQKVGAIVSPPNLVTASRLPLAASVWIAPGTTWFVAMVLTLAAATDVVDGWLARMLAKKQDARRARAAEMGAWLDPMCDKIFIVSVAAAVFVAERPPLGIMFLILTRELVLVPLVIIYRATPGLRGWLRYDFHAGQIGKLATVTQFFALGAVIAAPAYIEPLAYAAAGTGALAAANYIRRAQAIINRR